MQLRALQCYKQEVTKRCRLSWLTNSDLVYEPKLGGGVDKDTKKLKF
jgi:hypothetical protein